MNDKFLSSDGRDRRLRILAMAIGEARRRRQRRWIAPGAVTAIVGAVIVLSLRHSSRPPLPIWISPPVAVTPPPAPQPSAAIEYIETDPTITDRLTIKPDPPRWTTIGDDELLKELAAAGQPAGLAYVDGKAVLLPR